MRRMARHDFQMRDSATPILILENNGYSDRMRLVCWKTLQRLVLVRHRRLFFTVGQIADVAMRTQTSDETLQVDLVGGGGEHIYMHIYIYISIY